jgi:predicted RNase H-like nuclease (RuvC/YqgF family)
MRGELTRASSTMNANENKMKGILEQLNIYMVFEGKWKDTEARLVSVSQAFDNYREEAERGNRKRGADLEAQYARIRDLESTLEDYEGKVVMLSQELERMKAKCSGLEGKNVDLHKQAQAMASDLAYFREENERLQQTIRVHVSKIEEYRLSITQLEGQHDQRLEDYETKISKLSYEIERLNSVIRSKVADYDGLSARLDQFQKQLEAERKENGRLRAVEATADDLRSQVAIYNQELARLN